MVLHYIPKKLLCLALGFILHIKVVGSALGPVIYTILLGSALGFLLRTKLLHSDFGSLLHTKPPGLALGSQRKCWSVVFTEFS